MTAAGVWTYTLNDANATVQALNVGDTLTDTFTVNTVDGTPQTCTSPSTAPTTPRRSAATITGSVTEAAAPPHAAAIPEHNTAADGFAAVQTVAASTHDARTDDTAVSGESPDDGKISSLDGRDARFGGHERNLLPVVPETTISSLPRRQIPVQRALISSLASRQNSERIDLTALGALTFAVLALNSSSTTVPAHTIAWHHHSSANQTIVHVNSTDHVLSDPGDSSLEEIHLNGGFHHRDARISCLRRKRRGHAMGAEPLSLEPGAGNGAQPGGPTIGDQPLIRREAPICEPP